jgi:DNA-binding Lrp family transcriptional regulator
MESQQTDRNRVKKLKLLGIIIGIMVVIPILAWKWGIL